MRRPAVHRFWMGPRRDLTWSRTVVEHTQHRAVRDWTPATLPPEARWTLQGADARDVSNRLRYWLLATVGGLWLDVDVIPLRRLPTDTWTAAVGQQREGAAICFPEPGHPMAVALLEAVRDPDLATPTGALLLTEVGHGYPDVRLEHRVLPFDSFGQSTGVDDPLAVHTWETSARTIRTRASSWIQTDSKLA